MDNESEIEKIETIFSSSDFYENYAEQTTQLNARLNGAKAKVIKLYERWQELEKIKEEN